MQPIPPPDFSQWVADYIARQRTESQNIAAAMAYTMERFQQSVQETMEFLSEYFSTHTYEVYTGRYQTPPGGWPLDTEDDDEHI